jgi:bacterioferritin
MKGNKKLLKTLDTLLADELTAISQYMVHSEMCDNWGYKRLAKKVETRAIDEMKHAEKLIARILFLEGSPTVDKLNPIHIGADVAKQFDDDHAAEEGAIRMYNEAVRLADEVSDAATRTLLESILRDEDAHIDWLEAQLDQIKQMGVENYLAMQIEE